VRLGEGEARFGNRKSRADRGSAVLQFACPYCTGTFQVDPSMAGSEAMCPMCHGVIVVPSDPSAPPTAELQYEDQFAPPGEGFDFDFGGKKRRPTFEGLDDNPSPPPRFAEIEESDAKLPYSGCAAALLSMACPHCGAPFQVDATLAGQQAMCPTCQGVVVIPDMNVGHLQGGPPEPSLDPYAQFGTQTPMPQPPAPADFAPPFPAQPSASLTPSMPAPTSNPLPPGFGGPPLDAPQPKSLRTVAPLMPPTGAPLPARSSPESDVPLSARQTISASSDEHAGAAPGVGNDQPIEKAREEKILSRAAKVEAMLPEAADPDEEVVAERPIAAEEPPGDDFALDMAGSNQEATVTDADAPERRKTAEQRARLRRIRTMLIFAVGMLVLVIAAVVLPRMGYVVDIGKNPNKAAK
jgi:hypothetical protein